MKTLPVDILGHVRRIGASISFLTPVLLNLLLSQKLPLEEATVWLLVITMVGWSRTTLNSKNSDILNHFSARFADDKLTSVVRSLFVRESFFLFLQLCVAVIILWGSTLHDRPQFIGFIVAYTLGSSIREFCASYVRVSHGAIKYYNLLWLDGVARIVSFLVLYVFFSDSVAYISAFVVAPFVIFLPTLISALRTALSAVHLNSNDRGEIDGYFLISQASSAIKSTYQNIDIPLAPFLLSGGELWGYLTARQILIQAISLIFLPTTQSRIPKLMKKYRELRRNEFLQWLRKSIVSMGLQSVIVAFGLLVTCLFWLYSVDRSIPYSVGLLVMILSFVGVVRVNLWWNKDLLYIVNPNLNIFLAVVSATIVWIGYLISYYTDVSTIFFVSYFIAFLTNFLLSLLLTLRLRPRSGDL